MMRYGGDGPTAPAAAFSRAALIAPDNAFTWHVLGVVLYRLERWPDVAAAVQRVLTLDLRQR